MKKILIILFSLVSINSLKGQERKIERSTIMWDQYFLEASFSPKWSIYFDGGARFYNFYDTRFLTFFRPGITYKISPKWEVTAGYCWFINNETGYVENRPWQQIVRKDKINKLQITQRIRLEQRFQEDKLGDFFVFRSRYQLAFLYPIFPNSNRLLASVYQEIMPVWGDRVPDNHLDQYRAYVGFNYNFPQLTITAGYQYVWRWTTTDNSFKQDNCYRITLIHKIDL